MKGGRAIRKSILVGIGFIALYWVIESAVMALILKEVSFVEHIFILDTHELWMRFTGVGVIAAFVIYHHVVSTRHEKSEETIRISEEKYSAIFNEARDGIVLIDSETGSIIDCNPEFESQTGRELGQLKRMKIWEIRPPDMIESAKKKFLEVKMSGTGNSRELRFQKPNGESIPVEFLSNRIRIQGREYLQSFTRDITEQKRMEEKLQATSEREAKSAREWEELFDTASEIITRISSDFRFLKVNKASCEIVGMKREDLIGEKCYKIVHGLDHPIDGCPCEKALKTKKAETGEITQDGRCYIATACPILDEKGEVVSFAHTLTDITEHQQAEKKLEESRQQLRDLSAHLQSSREEERKRIARAVHDEMGQQLTALKIDLSWLAKKFSKGQESLLDKTKSMLTLVDETMKTVKQISGGLRPALLDDFGLSAAVEYHLEEFQELTGIECEAVLKPDSINLDEERSIAIFRILQETLTNVARHAQATKVKVSLQLEANKLALRISDNGSGTTERELLSPESFGLIGMRERIRVLKGKISISSIKDKGTTITVSIPIKNGEA